MTREELTERLRAHRLLADLPIDELAWIANHGWARTVLEGELLSSREAGLVEELLILLSGRVELWMDRGAGPRKVTEWASGDISGRFPYSRQTVSLGELRVEETGEIVGIHRDLFPRMIAECPELTTLLVRQMLDRARLFTRHDLHDEKMVSLGKLAAGLAHEMDNPASALVRGAQLLAPAVRQVGSAAQAIAAHSLSADERGAVESLRGSSAAGLGARPRSPLAQAEHEEALERWLNRRGVDTGCLDALVDTVISIEMLDSLAERIRPEALDATVQWLAAGCAVDRLAFELGQGATRISELVKAVKGFTSMDAAAVAQPVNVRTSLDQTLAMLQSRIRERGVRVATTPSPDLPEVEAVVGELNQVWFNLIDNAIHAAGSGGSVTIEAGRKGERVVVSVVDDGPGVPPEIRDRIFEPFFTTKPVGEGTGLGLDIVRRLVAQQGGSVELASAPGRTVFKVTLPVARSARDQR